MPASPYHHGRLREALIEAAVEGVRDRGPEAVVLRDLARRVGVSHNAAYRHFAHRDEIVAEVAGVGMGLLVDAIRERVAAVSATDPVVRARLRLAETGRAYVAFALAEPGLFRVAFGSTEALGKTASPDADPYAELGVVLDDLVSVGFLSPAARVDAEQTCWSAMHGFAVLNLEGPLRHSSSDQRLAALERVLIALDRSYGASTGVIADLHDLNR
ncbi:TetR/AcrR family transcriptional regulator [Nocardioides sp. AX2bis]|uniref:TetR/AcrR family transcriptional regulator n=1 Tax=Nocardioides sp. AX2bis TaxID=2653157 RepID=UPI00135A2D10|nr:TetR/AcrR family transcriptional regulator [Nocardioides sp. AX2bis]